MTLSRRDCLRLTSLGAGGMVASSMGRTSLAQDTPLNRLAKSRKDLTIKEFRVTPIALPDPPLLAASGCHGPYYLRTIVEIVTTDGISGVGEHLRDSAGCRRGAHRATRRARHPGSLKLPSSAASRHLLPALRGEGQHGA